MIFDFRAGMTVDVHTSSDASGSTFRVKLISRIELEDYDMPAYYGWNSSTKDGTRRRIHSSWFVAPSALEQLAWEAE